MEQPTTESKIAVLVKERLLGKEKMFLEQLAKGGLYSLEEALTEVLQGFCNLLAAENC